jgi:hypothetical protein
MLSDGTSAFCGPSSRMKPRDPEASVRVALRDVCARVAMGMVAPALSHCRAIRREASAAALSYHVGPRIADRLYSGRVVRSPHRFLKLPLAVAVPKGKHADLLDRLSVGIATYVQMVRGSILTTTG